MCCEYLLPAVTTVPSGSTDILVVGPCKNVEHGLQLVVMDAQLDRVPEDIPSPYCTSHFGAHAPRGRRSMS